MSVAMMSAADWVCLFCAAMAIVVSRTRRHGKAVVVWFAMAVGGGWRVRSVSISVAMMSAVG